MLLLHAFWACSAPMRLTRWPCMRLCASHTVDAAGTPCTACLLGLQCTDAANALALHAFVCFTHCGCRRHTLYCMLMLQTCSPCGREGTWARSTECGPNSVQRVSCECMGNQPLCGDAKATVSWQRMGNRSVAVPQSAMSPCHSPAQRHAAAARHVYAGWA